MSKPASTTAPFGQGILAAPRVDQVFDFDLARAKPVQISRRWLREDALEEHINGSRLRAPARISPSGRGGDSPDSMWSA